MNAGATDEQTWRHVDSYIDRTLGLGDPVLDAALKASDAAGLPRIAVSASQGEFLNLLARLVGARRILEVGTLGATPRSAWPGLCRRTGGW
jgi:predicted O-methyltransferase YrrM